LEIETSQAAYDVAKTALQQAQWYLDALNGKDVPVNAGALICRLIKQPNYNVQTTRLTWMPSIYAPMSGTILSISAKLNDNVSKSPFIVLAI